MDKVFTTEEIKKTLSSGVVNFKYTKKDGSERIATGTRNVDVITENSATPKGTGVEKDGVITYYDVIADGWRSFRVESFIEFIA